MAVPPVCARHTAQGTSLAERTHLAEEQLRRRRQRRIAVEAHAFIDAGRQVRGNDTRAHKERRRDDRQGL
jgi:hypothetical protein